MLYREIIAVCSQIHTKYTNTVCGQNVELYIKIQSVPRIKHTVSVIQNQTVNAVQVKSDCLFRYAHKTQKGTLCGQNVEFFNVEPTGT